MVVCERWALRCRNVVLRLSPAEDPGAYLTLTRLAASSLGAMDVEGRERDGPVCFSPRRNTDGTGRRYGGAPSVVRLFGERESEYDQNDGKLPRKVVSISERYQFQRRSTQHPCQTLKSIQQDPPPPPIWCTPHPHHRRASYPPPQTPPTSSPSPYPRRSHPALSTPRTAATVSASRASHP